MSTSLIPTHRAEIEKAIDSIMAELFDQLPVAEINIDPMTCRRDILQVLAYSYNIDLFGLEEPQQRRLVQKAFELNRYKGTVYAVKEALKALFPNATIIEHRDEPYVFSIMLEFTAADKYDRQAHAALLKLVHQAKNARSVLKGVQYAMPETKAQIKEISGIVLTI